MEIFRIWSVLLQICALKPAFLYALHGGPGLEVQGYAEEQGDDAGSNTNGANDTALRPSGVQATLELLQRGEQEIVLSDVYKDVVLVLGNTGAGKSTFTQWISKDDNGLEAVEITEGSGEFIIRDNSDRIGDSTIDSKTIFPEMVVDSSKNTAFYDVSGFSDTRSISNDIATSYFIKKIVDHVDSIKLCIVVSFPSVRKGVDRQDFMKLLRHLTELIKDINIFKDGIALIVTKVDNTYRRGTLVDDFKVIENIAIFLTETKYDLEKKINLSNVSLQNQFFYKNAVKFIDILLSKDGDRYKKIGLFRRPEETGPLRNIFQFEKDKLYIRSMIFDDLSYVENTKDLFGNTVSDTSKNEINGILKEINKNIWTLITSLSSETHTYLKNIIKQAELTINSFDINKTETIDSKLLQAQLYSKIITKGQDFLVNLIKEIKNTTDLTELSKKINNRIAGFDIPEAKRRASSLAIQVNYVDFLSEASDAQVKFSTNFLSWAYLFQNVMLNLSEPMNQIQISVANMAMQVEKKITTDIYKAANNLKSFFMTKQINDITLFHEQIKSGYEYLSKTLQMELLLPEKYIQALHNYNIALSDYTATKIIENNKYYEIFKSQVNYVIEYLNNSQKWCYFLTKLYDGLSEYRIQRDPSICSIPLNSVSFVENTKVENTGLNKLIDTCYSMGKNNYEQIKHIKLDIFQFTLLSDVLDLTLRHKLDDSHCDGKGNLRIKGQYLKLSDIKHKTCDNIVPKFIEIFALDTVFIDDDFDKTGDEVQLSIIAPTWVIVGDREIRLDGKSGSPHYLTKAADGVGQGANGEDGQPGLPGGPGGNFLGVGDTFINGERLTISANGGDGGPGQHGGNGMAGVDGTIPYLLKSSFDYCMLLDGERDDVINDWKKHGFSISSSEFSCTDLLHPFRRCRQHRVSGRSCTNGGNAGNAGYGGYAGNPGTIEILPHNYGYIQIVNKRGTTGTHGNCGYRGNAGSNGGRLGVTETIRQLIAHYWKIYEINSNEIITCNAGKSACWYNLNNIESPKILDTLIYGSKNYYITYLLNNINKTMRYSYLKKFLDII